LTVEASVTGRLCHRRHRRWQAVRVIRPVPDSLDRLTATVTFCRWLWWPVFRCCVWPANRELRC